jgi:surface polysaccharide O-acyltransferase-like enzyme
VLASACRSAVPFFFIASGYFMRVPSPWTFSAARRPLLRLLPVYIAWFLLYAGVDALLHGRVDGLTVRGLLTGGSAFHLWFLPVLGVTLAGVPAALALVGTRVTVSLAALLAVAGLAFGAYHAALHLHGIGGVRLTMAPALVLIGYGIRRADVALRTRRAMAMVLATLLLLLLEELLIAHLGGSAPTSHDIALMTYPLGAATFLLANSLNGARLLRLLAPLGTISLGVYASHLFFVGILAGSIGQDTPARACALAGAATLLATALSLALDRVPIARRLVR